MIFSAASAEGFISFRYRYGGLRLESSEPFPQLRVEDDTSGEWRASLYLEIMEGQLPSPQRTIFRWTGRYRLALGTIGDRWLLTSAFDCAFLIDETRNAIRCIVRDRNDPAWADVLVRRILPRVAMRYGALAMHASAAASGKGALLLLGESGAGKSTTAAALGAAGWDIFSDDMSMIWDFSDPQIAPASIGICVWPDTHSALGLPSERSVPMPGYAGKRRYVPGNETNTASRPLNAMVLLKRSEKENRVRLTRVPPIDALRHATRQRIRFNPADLTGPELHKTFAALSALTQAAPCYRLQYPADYEKLPDVVDQLGEMLEGCHARRPSAA